MTAHATSPTIDGHATVYEGVHYGLNTKTSWLMRGSRGRAGGPDPPEKSQKI